MGLWDQLPYALIWDIPTIEFTQIGHYLKDDTPCRVLHLYLFQQKRQKLMMI